MALKLLMATLHVEDRPYVDRLIMDGIDVHVLDCFDDWHSKLHTWYRDRTIFVPANRSSVLAAVQAHSFDLCIIRDSQDDFVRTALLTQTLRDARVGQVIVVTEDTQRVNLYRRCGAHLVYTADTTSAIWQQLLAHVTTNVFAS